MKDFTIHHYVFGESQREPPGLFSTARHNFSKGSRLKSLKVPTGVWGQDPIKQPYHTAGHNCVVENSEQRLLDKRIWGEIKKEEAKRGSRRATIRHFIHSSLICFKWLRERWALYKAIEDTFFFLLSSNSRSVRQNADKWKTIALYSHTHYTAAGGVLNCSYLYRSTCFAVA